MIEDLTTYLTITPLLHLIMILFVITLVVLISFAGIRMKRIGYLKSFSRYFGISLFAIWIIYNIYNFLPSNFRFETSLPLHICDILAIMASFSLIKPTRKTSAVLYFCALVLTTQAIITPNGNQDPATFRFWLFWFLHGGIIAASVYDLIVRKYRPVFKDFLFAVGFDLLYVAVILPLDIVFGWNYGFIGDFKPDTPTAIDFLGPWPQRLIWMIALAVFIQFLMYLPWRLGRRGRSY